MRTQDRRRNSLTQRTPLAHVRAACALMRHGNPRTDYTVGGVAARLVRVILAEADLDATFKRLHVTAAWRKALRASRTEAGRLLRYADHRTDKAEYKACPYLTGDPPCNCQDPSDCVRGLDEKEQGGADAAGVEVDAQLPRQAEAAAKRGGA